MKPIANARVQSSDAAYRQDITTGSHTLVNDEGVTAGGHDAGPAPYDYLLASLGAYTALTLDMYA